MRRTLGFTLIELLVTITIMAVIVGASLVAFAGTRASARDSRRKADIEALRSALELYRSDTGGYPDNLNILLGPPPLPVYIAAIPADPLAGRSYGYLLTAPTYQLCAALENSGGASCTPACGVTCNYKTTNP